SAVRTAGLSPAKLDQIRERILYIRALLAGEEVEPLVFEGQRREGTWGMVDKVHLEGAQAWGALPIEMACMGPKSVEVAGEIADGVIVDGHMGGNAEGVRATVEAARRGAERAGRDASALRF